MSRYKPSLKFLALSLLMVLSAARMQGQCAGEVSSPAAVADCAARETPREGAAVLDPVHPYTLAELIDVAEHHNPGTRAIWERAKQKAGELGLARSTYYPELEGLAVFGDERLINPFPKPLAPRGYVMVEIPKVQPEVTLEYLIFDFGKREATVGAAKQEKLAAGADFIQVNQALAFRVASAYYQLVTAQEGLQAAQDTLQTAQTTQDAAENRLQNGLATLPDVLQARAETSQALFDEQSADGDEKIARVTLTEAVGADPSPDIVIDSQRSAPLPESLTMSIEALLDRAMANRPDLMAQTLRIRAADARIRAAKAEYKPQFVLSGAGAQTSVWPSADYGELGAASEIRGPQNSPYDGASSTEAPAKTKCESPNRNAGKRTMSLRRSMIRRRARSGRLTSRSGRRCENTTPQSRCLSLPTLRTRHRSTHTNTELRTWSMLLPQRSNWLKLDSPACLRDQSFS